MTADDNNGLPKAVESLSSASPYEEAMTALSSLITKRSRADTSNKGDRFDLLFEYLKILELEDPISKMKIIHVAGTKGKGSTCVFTESILRNCGFHTGLFTSPHLIDVRERFRLDGVDICEEKFLAYFWWCYDRLKEKVTDDVPMPTYFRFLALLAFKIFASEQVDVAILEVGLGGKFDATNVVQSPVVCGITSLGYDHMEILGNTLGQIAGQKAGIFKHGVPAFTVQQPDEAMQVLEDTAAQLDVNLRVVAPLDAHLLNDIQLGLGGEHQFVNAGLAVALCSTWLHRTGHLEFPYMDQMTSLPEQFFQGLVTARLQGRAQIVHDEYVSDERSGDLAFYLDGAHTPESMEVCARWFSHIIKKEDQYPSSFAYQPSNNSGVSHELASRLYRGTGKKSSTQILLFNCMSVRDPQLLLPSLMNSCATHGVHFKQALFVPNISFYHKVVTHVPSLDPQVDLSWQLNLQRLWETLTSQKGAKAKDLDCSPKEPRDGIDMYVKHDAHSKVFPTLPSAIKWLRESVKQNQSIRFQVLVTGSLHLVGDVLRLIKK